MPTMVLYLAHPDEARTSALRCPLSEMHDVTGRNAKSRS